MNVGERIKKRRLELEIGQSELADKIGISKQTLYKYENNIVTNIPSDKLEKIAEALDVSPGNLMGWSDNAVFDAEKGILRVLKSRSKKQNAYLRGEIKELDSIQQELSIYGFSPRMLKYNKLLENPLYQYLLDAAEGCTDNQIKIATETLNAFKKIEDKT